YSLCLQGKLDLFQVNFKELPSPPSEESQENETCCCGMSTTEVFVLRTAAGIPSGRNCRCGHARNLLVGSTGHIGTSLPYSIRAFFFTGLIPFSRPIV